MIAAAPPSPPPIETLTIQPIGGRWRVTSSDGLFEGVFTDAKSAVQCARAEAEAHSGHILVLADIRPATCPLEPETKKAGAISRSGLRLYRFWRPDQAAPSAFFFDTSE